MSYNGGGRGPTNMGYGRRETGDSRSGGGRGVMADINSRSRKHYQSKAYLSMFLGIRGVLMAVLISLIGLSGAWIHTLGANGHKIPHDIVVVLVFAALGLLHNFVYTFIAFMGFAVALMVLGVLDIMFIVYFSIAAVRLSPVAFLDCKNRDSRLAQEKAPTPSSLAAALPHRNFSTKLADWAVYSTEQCMEIEATWALCIVLPAVFLIGLLVTAGMVYGKKLSKKGGKGHYNDDESDDDNGDVRGYSQQRDYNY